MAHRPTEASDPPTSAVAPVFPVAGARARRLKRFERDLGDWLSLPDGRFAQWRACRRIATADQEDAVSR
jgi:hypothetical protein